MNECYKLKKVFSNEICSDEGHSMTLCQICSTDLLLRKFQLGDVNLNWMLTLQNSDTYTKLGTTTKNAG